MTADERTADGRMMADGRLRTADGRRRYGGRLSADVMYNNINT
jgi:hypothetical protein